MYPNSKKIPNNTNVNDTNVEDEDEEDNDVKMNEIIEKKESPMQNNTELPVVQVVVQSKKQPSQPSNYKKTKQPNQYTSHINKRDPSVKLSVLKPPSKKSSFDDVDENSTTTSFLDSALNEYTWQEALMSCVKSQMPSFLQGKVNKFEDSKNMRNRGRLKMVIPVLRERWAGVAIFMELGTRNGNSSVAYNLVQGTSLMQDFELLLESAIQSPLFSEFLYPLEPTIKSWKGVLPEHASKTLKVPMGIENVLERVRSGYYPIDAPDGTNEAFLRDIRRVFKNYSIWYDPDAEIVLRADNIERVLLTGYDRIMHRHLADDYSAPGTGYEVRYVNVLEEENNRTASAALASSSSSSSSSSPENNLFEQINPSSTFATSSSSFSSTSSTTTEGPVTMEVLDYYRKTSTVKVRNLQTREIIENVPLSSLRGIPNGIDHATMRCQCIINALLINKRSLPFRVPLNLQHFRSKDVLAVCDERGPMDLTTINNKLNTLEYSDGNGGITQGKNKEKKKER